MITKRSDRNLSWPVLILLIGLMGLFCLSGCYKQHRFPVPVTEGRLSPVYRLEIRNKTSQVLTFLPRDNAEPSIKSKPVAVDAIFTTQLQVREVMIGQTQTNEVVPGPYIDSGRSGPNIAIVRYQETSGRNRQFQILIESESWFGANPNTQPAAGTDAPRTLKADLTQDAVRRDKAKKWFRDGPDTRH